MFEFKPGNRWGTGNVVNQSNNNLNTNLRSSLDCSALLGSRSFERRA